MGHTSDANEASAASLTSTVLDEEAASLAAQQQAAAHRVGGMAVSHGDVSNIVVCRGKVGAYRSACDCQGDQHNHPIENRHCFITCGFSRLAAMAHIDRAFRSNIKLRHLQLGS